MKLPKSFNELTVEQYQRITEIQGSDLDKLDKSIEIISYLSGKTVTEIESLYSPSEVFTKTSFLNNAQVNETWGKRIRVGSRFYMPIIKNEDFKAGALIALKHFEKQDVVKNLHQMLACCYSPMGWDFKPKPYNGNNHQKIAKDMLKVKMGDVYGFLAFKKKVFLKSSPVLTTYLTQATQTIEMTLKELGIELQAS
jgi:hypothetical protein